MTPGALEKRVVSPSTGMTSPPFSNFCRLFLDSVAHKQQIRQRDLKNLDNQQTRMSPIAAEHSLSRSSPLLAECPLSNLRSHAGEDTGLR
jgi:hypothetical protein